jgi:hypothetical protein
MLTTTKVSTLYAKKDQDYISKELNTKGTGSFTT